MSRLDARWPLAFPPVSAARSCPAADTGVCLCAHCVLGRTRERLHVAAVKALGRADVAAWVGPCADGWIAEVDTDDGCIALRCRERSPERAAQLMTRTLGSAS